MHGVVLSMYSVVCTVKFVLCTVQHVLFSFCCVISVYSYHTFISQFFLGPEPRLPQGEQPWPLVGGPGSGVIVAGSNSSQSLKG